MFKNELDKLLKENVLTQEEYDSFFLGMSVDENGRMTGVMPLGSAWHKYDLDGNLVDGGSILSFLLERVTVPQGAEHFSETFKKYGTTGCGLYDGWFWFDKIDENGVRHGKLVEDATNEELWEMIAISSRYWQVFYDRAYYEEREKI